MQIEQRRGLKKTERLSSLTVINQLFGGRESLRTSAYPLAAVYSLIPKGRLMRQNAMLVSVPKRRFKHSVDRNRIKRQVREAYRLNKDILQPLADIYPDRAVAIGFIYLSDQHTPSVDMQRRVKRLLHLIADRLQQKQTAMKAMPELSAESHE